MDDRSNTPEDADGIDTDLPPADTSSTDNSDRVNVVADEQLQKAPSTYDIDRIAERLTHELELSKTYQLQTKCHWRQVLAEEKFQELHNVIPWLIQTHAENVARKKEVALALHKECTALQELYRDAMIANMNRIECLIAIHEDQVVKLERDFRHSVSSLHSQYQNEFVEIDSQYNNEKKAVRACIQSQADRYERQITAMRQEHSSELETIKKRNNDIIHGIRSVMDLKCDDLEEQVEVVHGEFAQNTQGTRIVYSQLKSKDDDMHDEISAKMQHANRLQRAIQRLRLIAKQEEAQRTERHRELVARKGRAMAHWHSMEAEMTTCRNEQQMRLRNLTRCANARKEALLRVVELAERVTKIGVACQKYESLREKFASQLRDRMLPTTSKGVESVVEEEETNNNQRELIVRCMEQLGGTTHHFWNKYNMAKLDVLISTIYISSHSDTFTSNQIGVDRESHHLFSIPCHM